MNFNYPGPDNSPKHPKKHHPKHKDEDLNTNMRRQDSSANYHVKTQTETKPPSFIPWWVIKSSNTTFQPVAVDGTLSTKNRENETVVPERIRQSRSLSSAEVSKNAEKSALNRLTVRNMLSNRRSRRAVNYIAAHNDEVARSIEAIVKLKTDAEKKQLEDKTSAKLRAHTEQTKRDQALM